MVRLWDFLGREEGARGPSDDLPLDAGVEVSDGCLEGKGVLLVKGEECLEECGFGVGVMCAGIDDDGGEGTCAGLGRIGETTATLVNVYFLVDSSEVVEHAFLILC